MKFLLPYLWFLADNLAGTVAFYAAFNLFGTKPAIALQVTICVAQLLHHRLKKLPFSPLFFILNGTMIFLGLLDLAIDSPRFVRLEPGLASVIPASLVLFSLLTRKPLLSTMMESSPGYFKLNPGEVDRAYIVRFSWLIALLTYAKAGICFYAAYHVNLGDLWALRKILGLVVALFVFGGEAFLRKWFQKRKREEARRLLPLQV